MSKEIKLTQGQVAIVDDEDFDRLNTYEWQASKDYKTVYARRQRGEGELPKWIGMHNEVLPTEPGYTPDHIDGDGLNNRRNNLRAATRHQQMGNTRKIRTCSSQFKGIYFHKRDKQWYSQIKRHGKKIYLGSFATEEAAARAYDVAAKEYFGEFARLNFPD